MKLNHLKTIHELLDFLPSLVKLFEEQRLDGLWKAEMTKEEFVAGLTNNVNQLACFGERDETGVKYFFAVCCDSRLASVWVFYVSIDARDHTKVLFSELKEVLSTCGIKSLKFYTRKLTRSYDRWITKLGAERFQVTYQITLN